MFGVCEPGFDPSMLLQVPAQGAAPRRAGSVERTPGYRVKALRATHEGACTRASSTSADRGGVPDLSVSGDSFDLVGDNPHDPTTTSETRSANAIAEPTPDGYRPCQRKISLITKINSCAQSKNEQESEASNLNITRKWSSESQRTARICACSGVAKARCKTKLKP
jgi:hypothetical protein